MQHNKILQSLILAFLMSFSSVSTSSWAMDDKDGAPVSKPPIKAKGFSDLTKSAFEGNAEDKAFLRLLLPLTLELEKWIDPKEALTFFQQKVKEGNAEAQTYENLVSGALQKRHTLAYGELKGALNSFLEAVSRGYGPALSNVGVIYIRFFLTNKQTVDRANTQLLLRATSEFHPPKYAKESGNWLPEALDYGTQALHVANDDPRMLQGASCLIVSALTGNWQDSDKTCSNWKPCHRPDFNVISKSIKKFEEKIQKLHSLDIPPSDKIKYYEDLKANLQNFMEIYPHKFSSLYLYLPLPKNLHHSWKGQTIKGQYYEVSSSSFCITTPILPEEPTLQPLEQLMKRYQNKATRIGTKGYQLKASKEKMQKSMEEFTTEFEKSLTLVNTKASSDLNTAEKKGLTQEASHLSKHAQAIQTELQLTLNAYHKSEQKARKKQSELQELVELCTHKTRMKTLTLKNNFPIFEALVWD